MRILLLMLSVVLLGCGPGRQIPAPDDVAKAPESAIVTSSGLAYVVLKESDGTSPRISDKVLVHYTGWTVDGKMFDSSVARGKPAKFGVSEVIAGWTEALLLMKTGSEYRLWIPEALAYRGESGFPAGMLVFDVSLLSIE